VLHGTPMSRLLYERWTTDARSIGVRLISYDRPGYGGSTPVPGRRVVDASADVVAIANHLGIDQFAVWGFSGGGAPALACAATRPDRAVAVASLEGLAPYPAEGLDWNAGMGVMSRPDFELLFRDQPAWESKCRKGREATLGSSRSPELFRQALSPLLSEADRAAFSEEVAGFLLRSWQEGLKVGDEGVRDDFLSQVKPWGFDLEGIRIPVQIWHGAQDRFVPFSHGKWLASRVPGAELHLEPDEGHISMISTHIPDVQRWLASKF